MRAFIFGALTASALAVAVPAAAQNGFMDQAQRFLNQNGNSSDDAYQRGREDQARQERYNRDQRRAERQDQRYRDQQYSYDRDQRYGDDPNYRR